MGSTRNSFEFFVSFLLVSTIHTLKNGLLNQLSLFKIKSLKEFYKSINYTPHIFFVYHITDCIISILIISRLFRQRLNIVFRFLCFLFHLGINFLHANKEGNTHLSRDNVHFCYMKNPPIKFFILLK